jgi:hypothetical protein
MDIGDRIIAVVHETYWLTATGNFCTLKPIADISGDIIEPSEFYNRGRVWWKVRNEDLSYASLGRIISVEIEHSVSFDQSDHNKDFFQVSSGTVTGPEYYIAEIVEMDKTLSPLSLIETGRIKCNHPIRNGAVFCRSGSIVIGPFTVAGVEPIRDEKIAVFISLSPGWGNQQLRQMAWNEFLNIAQPRVIPMRIFTEAHERSPIDIEYCFFPKDRLEKLLSSAIGNEIDSRSDKMVVSEVVKDLKWSRADKQSLTRLVDEIHCADPGLDRVNKNKNRILNIVKKIKGNEQIILELLDTLLENEKLQSLLQVRINERVDNYIEENRKDLEHHANEKIFQKKKELSDLEKSINVLQDQIEAEKKEKFQEYERFLHNKKTEIDQLFQQREEEFFNKEKEFIGKQEYLSNLVNKLSQNRDEIVASLIGLMPVLQEMGFQIISDKSDKAAQKEDNQETKEPVNINPYKPLHGIPKTLSESEFLDRWLKLVNDSGFSYNEKDLRNFHICTKSENFNILTGPSGIGKSSLPRFYSQALHGNAEGKMRYLSVSVKPGWLDSQELIGYFNSLDGRFQPSSSGFYQFLVASHKESIEPESGIHICCLDEMNLSYVEQYFADFLVLLQAPLQDRQIKFFDKNLCRIDDAYRGFHQIHLPSSLRFCGTVNVDETTKFFSPKVLDRVHLIEMGSVALSNINSWNEHVSDNIETGTPISSRIYFSWSQDPGIVQEYALKSIGEIENLLSMMGIGISPRTFKSICRYVSNSRNVMESDEEAMDYAIFQKILPGLRGHSTQFREMLFKLIEITESKNYIRSSSRIRLIAEAPIAMDFFNYSMT